MKKRILILSCIMTAMLAVTACGDNKKTTIAEDTMNTADVTETVSTETTEPVAETITEEPTESVSDNTAALESETEPTTVETEPVESDTIKATAEPTAQTAPEPAYTYTDAESVMYAKSSVNVRDLPSVDGTKLGGLNQNQEITVTGTCNETGWYRIAYKDAIGYVSNKYLVTEKIAATQTPAPANTTASTGKSIGDAPAPAQAPPVLKEVNSAIVIPDPIIITSGGKTAPAPSDSTIRDGFDLSTPEGLTGWLQAGHSSSEIINEDPGVQSVTCTISIREDSYTVGKRVLELMNQDRASEGLPALIWSDDLYNIAMQRCMENDGHNSMRAGTTENGSCSIAPDCSAEDIFWGDSTSPKHRDNYMRSDLVYGAVAANQSIRNDGWNDGTSYMVFSW